MEFHTIKAAVMLNELGVDGIEAPPNQSELVTYTVPEIHHRVHEFAAVRLVFHEEIGPY